MIRRKRLGDFCLSKKSSSKPYSTHGDRQKNMKFGQNMTASPKASLRKFHRQFKAEVNRDFPKVPKTHVVARILVSLTQFHEKTLSGENGKIVLFKNNDHNSKLWRRCGIRVCIVFLLSYRVANPFIHRWASVLGTRRSGWDCVRNRSSAYVEVITGDLHFVSLGQNYEPSTDEDFGLFFIRRKIVFCNSPFWKLSVHVTFFSCIDGSLVNGLSRCTNQSERVWFWEENHLFLCSRTFKTLPNLSKLKTFRWTVWFIN